MRAILFTGGIYHAFDQMSAAVAGILAGAGITVEIVTQPTELVAALQRPADLVVVQALRWRMLGNDKYAPFRAEWAYETTPDLITALNGHARRGGGILALHTGCISFDDWPGWHDLLGGGWVWGHSFHAPGLEQVTLTPLPHPVTAGIAPFEVLDEHYRNLLLQPQSQVLAQGKTATGESHPVAWAKDDTSSRSVTLTLGHDLASLTHPAQARLIRQAALWAARQIEGETA